MAKRQLEELKRSLAVRLDRPRATKKSGFIYELRGPVKLQAKTQNIGFLAKEK